MVATLASLLCRTNQALDFRNMFILGHTVEVDLQCSQLVFAHCKLAIRKDLGQSEIVFPIELVQCWKRRYNNVPIHGTREDTDCVIVDVLGCCEQEWHLINVHDINCQNNLFIVVLYMLGYRDYIRLYSSFLFPHHFFFSARYTWS